MSEPVTTEQPLGLLLDYGGVLTTPPASSFLAWEAAHGFGRGEVLSLIGDAYDDHDGGLVGRLERGEISADEFDAGLARIFERHGHTFADGSLVDAMFAGMQPAGELWDVAERARAAGVRTGILSNSWGMGMYPYERLEASFDVLVISGEVGLRKPDPAIYELAAERIGLPPQRCAFVDDLDKNVEVATGLGMFGVVHADDTASTLAELRRFLPL